MAKGKRGLNLQNIPPWFRGVIVADPGKVLVEWDLSQAEARIVAYLAGEEDMIEVFNDPKRSIHKLNASKTFGIPEEEVVKDSDATQPYGMAKRCIHGWHYFLGDKHAAQITGKTVKEMQKHREAYFRSYPNLLEWHKFIKNCALGNKTLVTPYGRVRKFLGRPPKRTEDGELMPNEELVKKMVAHVPQSTCTEYLKRGFLRIKKEWLDFELLMDVHDSGVAQVWLEGLDKFIEVVERLTCVPLKVMDIFGRTREMIIPLEFKTGYRWGRGMK